MKYPKGTKLGETNTDLLKEWNYERNIDITPMDVTYAGSAKVWWRCKKGHEWKANVSSRTLVKSNCPYCYGRFPSKENNLSTKFPELVREWSMDNTNPPTEYLPNHKSEVKWRCEKGHQWIESIRKRTVNGSKCPYCTNSVKVKFPELISKWSKKNPHKPEMTIYKNTTKYWWTCENNHDYLNSVLPQKKGIGCPICSGRQATSEDNLAVQNPELARQWSPKNSIKPTEVKPFSKKIVWWQCKEGHEWEAMIFNRNRQKEVSCPTCKKESRQKVNINLDKQLPVSKTPLINEWSEKNTLDPTKTSSGSHKKAFWKCKENHEWMSSIGNRKKNGCPYCAGYYATEENNFAIKCPHLVSEWSSKNELLPQEVRPYSSKKIIWECKEGHEWVSLVKARTQGNGCPECAKKLISDKRKEREKRKFK